MNSVILIEKQQAIYNKLATVVYCIRMLDAANPATLKQLANVNKAPYVRSIRAYVRTRGQRAPCSRVTVTHSVTASQSPRCNKTTARRNKQREVFPEQEHCIRAPQMSRGDQRERDRAKKQAKLAKTKKAVKVCDKAPYLRVCWNATAL